MEEEEKLINAICPSLPSDGVIGNKDDVEEKEEEMFGVELVLHQALHLPKNRCAQQLCV